MKTPLQELIDWLDPIHDSIKQKAISLLEKEKEIIITSYNTGNKDYANFNYIAESGKDYYDKK